MLTDAEKQRIIEEERFRGTARSEFAPKKSRTDKLLTFLNSPIVLWCLSSILLAGAANWYALWTERLQRQEQIELLTLELSSRIDDLSVTVDDIIYRSKKYGTLKTTDVRDIQTSILSNTSDHLFRDYENVDLQGLLWKLKVIHPNDGKTASALGAAIALSIAAGARTSFAAWPAWRLRDRWSLSGRFAVAELGVPRA